VEFDGVICLKSYYPTFPCYQCSVTWITPDLHHCMMVGDVISNPARSWVNLYEW